ncbi:DUF3488 and transglutaminase-like domain-containing protein [Schaalia suimastitidis]|uniref:DUF3488 and transglutaminase-like domain-containing protein n=1 Tax=Schaalia suimastitidis TaxID=121163 RepID=UPI0013F45D45|nr:transglutaminase domain-containing protein [Schaalia suimastitidis]
MSKSSAGWPGTSRRGYFLAAVIVWVMWSLHFDAFEAIFGTGRWRVEAWMALSIALIGAALVRMLLPRWRIRAATLSTCAALWYSAYLLYSGGRLGEWVSTPAVKISEFAVLAASSQAPMVMTHVANDTVMFAGLCVGILCAYVLVAAELPLILGAASIAPVLIVPQVFERPVNFGEVVPFVVLWAVLLFASSPRFVAPALRDDASWPHHAQVRVAALGGDASAIGSITARIRHGMWRAWAALIVVALSCGVVYAAPELTPRMIIEAFDLPSTSAGGGVGSEQPIGASTPDVTVDLGAALRRGSTATVFTYQGVPEGLTSRFVLATLADFTQGVWQPVDADDSQLIRLREVDEAEIAMPDMVSGQYAGAVEQLRSLGIATGRSYYTSRTIVVTVKELNSTWLPVLQSTAFVERIAGSLVDGETFTVGNWGWVPGTDTVRASADMTKRGQTYAIGGWTTQGDDVSTYGASQALETASEYAVFDDFGPYQPQMERYLALPDGVPALLSQTAAEAVAGAQGAQAQALALQQWFTSGAFFYDENAPYTEQTMPDNPYAVMEALLERRSGYCVHYASTFAVMMRTLGVPSRVAVGYVSRAQLGATNVASRDLHAWPEIHVDGVGWVAYEPTPGGSAWRAEGREALIASAPESSEQAVPTPSSTNAQTPQHTPDTSEVADTGVALPAIPVNDGVLLAAFFLSLVVLGAITPAVVRRHRRSERLRGVHVEQGPAAGVDQVCQENRRATHLRSSTRQRRLVLDAESAWQEIADTVVDLGYLPRRGKTVVLRSQTPEALCEYLVDTGVITGRKVERLRRLAYQVSRARYSPRVGPMPVQASVVHSGGTVLARIDEAGAEQVEYRRAGPQVHYQLVAGQAASLNAVVVESHDVETVLLTLWDRASRTDRLVASIWPVSIGRLSSGP